MHANQHIFKDKFSYIAEAQDTMRATVIAMAVLCAFFLIIGIVAITVYKMADPKRKNSREEELVNDYALRD